MDDPCALRSGHSLTEGPGPGFLLSGGKKACQTKQVIGCVDYIYEGEKNYPTSESTQEELKEFFENLAQEQFAKLRKFFDTMPKLRHECKVKNPKTGVESTVTFSGLQDFFGLASPTTA